MPTRVWLTKDRRCDPFFQCEGTGTFHLAAKGHRAWYIYPSFHQLLLGAERLADSNKIRNSDNSFRGKSFFPFPHFLGKIIYVALIFLVFSLLFSDFKPLQSFLKPLSAFSCIWQRVVVASKLFHCHIHCEDKPPGRGKKSC